MARAKIIKWAGNRLSRALPCGCAYAPGPEPGVVGMAGIDRLILFCADGRSLDTVRRLTADFAAVAPADPIIAKLATVASDALARHLGLPEAGAEGERAAILPEPRKAPRPAGRQVPRIVEACPAPRHGEPRP